MEGALFQIPVQTPESFLVLPFGTGLPNRESLLRPPDYLLFLHLTSPFGHYFSLCMSTDFIIFKEKVLRGS